MRDTNHHGQESRKTQDRRLGAEVLEGTEDDPVEQTSRSRGSGSRPKRRRREARIHGAAQHRSKDRRRQNAGRQEEGGRQEAFAPGSARRERAREGRRGWRAQEE